MNRPERLARRRPEDRGRSGNTAIAGFHGERRANLKSPWLGTSRQDDRLGIDQQIEQVQRAVGDRALSVSEQA
jgi:hypothetical protein